MPTVIAPSALPTIHLPFPARINPVSSELEGCLRQWAGESKLVQADDGAWKRAKFHLLAGRMFPNAPLPLLSVISVPVIWLFLVDDHLDTAVKPEDIEYAANLTRQTRDVLTGSAHVAPPNDPLLACIWSFRQRMEPLVTSQWWARCGQDLYEFVESIYRETCARTQNQLPSLENFLLHRQRTSGWHVLTNLAELDAGVDIPAGIRESTPGRDVRRIAGDVACTINDVLSLRREHAAGEVHNFVLITQRTEGCSLAEALEQTSQRIDKSLTSYLAARERFLALCARLTGSPGVEPAVRYLESLEHLMRGSLDWSLETGKYAA